MRKRIDLMEQKFGKLTVVAYYGPNKSGNSLWECLCDCGKFTVVESYLLRTGATQSCGCKVSERMAARNYRHGMFGSRIYEIWRKMRRRCHSRSDRAYQRYGGRGINICKEWDNLENGFHNFHNWAMNNGYADNLSIDRIDNDGNYEPSNCRWVDAKTQCNNRSSNHKVDYRGETLTITQLANKIGIKPTNMWSFLSRNGWNSELAVKAAKGGDNNDRNVK